MGPEATVDLFARILRTQHRQFIALQKAVQEGRSPREQLDICRAVSCAHWTLEEIDRLAQFPGDIRKARWDDQHHIPFIVSNASLIPDRTEWLLHPKPPTLDPRPAMLSATRALMAAGANLLAIPCNTAHAFVPEIRALCSGLEVLHMPELAIEYAHRRADHTDRQHEELVLGVLATTGTLSCGIYDAAVEVVSRRSHLSVPRAIRLLRPDEVRGGSQAAVMEAIYGARGLKAGFADPSEEHGQRNAALLAEQCRALESAGAEAVIAGCTELPLVMQGPGVINPTQVLADEVVRRALRDRF